MITWAQHVGKFAKENNMKLGQAMKSSKCKAEWKKIKNSGGDPTTSDEPLPEPVLTAGESAGESAGEPPVPAVEQVKKGGRRRKSLKKTKKNRRSKKSRKNYR